MNSFNYSLSLYLSFSQICHGVLDVSILIHVCLLPESDFMVFLEFSVCRWIIFFENVFALCSQVASSLWLHGQNSQSIGIRLFDFISLASERLVALCQRQNWTDNIYTPKHNRMKSCAAWKGRTHTHTLIKKAEHSSATSEEIAHIDNISQSYLSPCIRIVVCWFVLVCALVMYSICIAHWIEDIQKWLFFDLFHSPCPPRGAASPTAAAAAGAIVVAPLNQTAEALDFFPFPYRIRMRFAVVVCSIHRHFLESRSSIRWLRVNWKNQPLALKRSSLIDQYRIANWTAIQANE